MKTFKIIIMILAISVAFYEQVSEEKNIYIMIACNCGFYVWNDAIERKNAK
ncbi:hypothetical protein [Flavobacterium ginsengisoli]|uniref:hypothetical protein n=1 Tax=Flavobacterium ginsengisoli TaxID=871694 RepID=UPI002414E31F|nr:hypothetical protein [Flavobacterium ginsengisoli]